MRLTPTYKNLSLPASFSGFFPVIRPKSVNEPDVWKIYWRPAKRSRTWRSVLKPPPKSDGTHSRFVDRVLREVRGQTPGYNLDTDMDIGALITSKHEARFRGPIATGVDKGLSFYSTVGRLNSMATTAVTSSV